MKILYWAGHIGNKFGAYEKYILLLARVCRVKGHQLTVLHEGSNHVSFYRSSLSEFGAEYIEIPHTLKEPFRGIPPAISIIKKQQPDIVHFNFTNPLVMPFAKVLGVPQVYRTCHNGIQKVTLKTRLSRIMNNQFMDRFFAVSRRVERDEIQAGIRKDKLFLNFLGLPIEYYAEENGAKIEAPLPFGSDDPQIRKIITIGRFFPEKGMTFVTEVAVETLRNFPDVIWWMVGGAGPDYEFCKEMVQKSDIKNRLVFLGQRNDVPALLKQAYMQVVGPLFEGLGLSVLESSLLGVPTIGPAIRGMDEAIQNDQTGILVGSRSTGSFTSAIGSLFGNPQMRDQMGANAKKYIIENHNSSYWIGQLINYYELDYQKRA